jgi:hypothetical protein
MGKLIKTNINNSNYNQMTHKIVNGLHCIISAKGTVDVYTEKEYQEFNWWNRMKLKYNLKSK